MDEKDRVIVERLMTDGRATWADLARDVGLSPPSVAERVRKLEEEGVVAGYSTRVDPIAVGARTLAFVFVATTGPEAHPTIAEWVARTPEVQECHLVSGDHDYALKVRCRSANHLGRFLREELRAIEGIARTVSTITMGTLKETTVLPLEEGPDPDGDSGPGPPG